MAESWIKIRTSLPTSPALVRIASACKADRLRTLGGFVSALCLADTHAELDGADGRLDGYTPEVFDDLVGLPGLCDALALHGWVRVESDSIVFQRFTNHNGTPAKRRSLDAKRKQGGRGVRNVSACKADDMRNREEKRREEEKSVCDSAHGCASSSAAADANASGMAALGVMSADFRNWFAKYPKQLNERAAWRAWRKALEEGVTVAQLYNGLRLSPALQREHRYLPQAHDWIENGGYNDQPEPETATVGGGSEDADLETAKRLGFVK